MRKYFEYEFKKSLFLIGCLTVIASALELVFLIDIDNGYGALLGLGVIISVGGFLAAGMPFWVFEYRMKKRSMDLYYALPLSHTKIITVKFLVGLIIVLIPYTVAYFMGAIFAIPRLSPYYFYPVYYVPMYFATLIPIYFIYAISAFLYTRANRRRDGQSFVLLWFFALALVAVILALLTDVQTDNSIEGFMIFNTVYFVHPYYYTPFAPLSTVCSAFETLIAGNALPEYGVIELANMIVGFTIITLWAAGSTAGIILLEKNTKAENTEQISESPFGYKVLIPLYTTCLVALCAGIGYVSSILIIMVIVGMYALCVSYKRSVKIGWKQFAILIGSVILGLILYFLCFHLSW